MRFVDTNVLLYAASTAADEQEKSRVARTLLRRDDLAVSVQVLQEFYVQATRRSRAERLSLDDAAALIAAWQRFPVVVVTPAVMTAAIDSSRRFQISYWDAAVLEAARSIGADIVWSEDLADGRDYDGVRVQNPFAAGAAVDDGRT